VRRAAVLAVVALATLAACGSEATSDGRTGAPSAGTSLTVVVTPDEGKDASTYELTCDQAGGDHPQPEQACEAVAAAGASVFEPVPAGQSCTQIFGGPQTATVTGTYDGRQVDATFSRTDGCEIARWDELGTTFFTVPLQ